MTVTVLGYLALAGAVAGLEIFARRPGTPVPTAADCLAYLTRSPVGRAVTLLAWLWVGWHFFAR